MKRSAKHASTSNANSQSTTILKLFSTLHIASLAKKAQTQNINSCLISNTVYVLLVFQVPFRLHQIVRLATSPMKVLGVPFHTSPLPASLHYRRTRKSAHRTQPVSTSLTCLADKTSSIAHSYVVRIFRMQKMLLFVVR